MTNDVGKIISRRQGLEIDVVKYQAMIDDPGLSKEEKHEFIRVMWQLIVNFVDLGFGIHPVQQACGQLPVIDNKPTIELPDMLVLDHHITDEFETASIRAGKDESG